MRGQNSQTYVVTSSDSKLSPWYPKILETSKHWNTPTITSTLNSQLRTSTPTPNTTLKPFRFESYATGAYILLLLSCLLHVYEQTSHIYSHTHTHSRTCVVMVCELVVAAKWKRIRRYLAFFLFGSIEILLRQSNY